MAAMLEKKYGWRVADWNQIVSKRMGELKVEYENEHPPNNPVAEDRKIGLSEIEWNDLINGKLKESWKYFPWFYQYLGLPLEKKRPPPPVPKEEIEGQEDVQEVKPVTPPQQLTRKQKRELELKKKAEEDKKKKKMEQDEGEAGEGEESEEEPLEDLKITEIDLVFNEESKSKPFVGQFILINFPETAEQIEKLKAEGIEFDKIIYLTDINEEEPGKVFIE